MGVATLCISCEALADIIGMFKHMGINIVGSREGDYGCVCLVVEGECVPDASMVMATVHATRAPEANSLRLTFEVDEP